MAPMLPRGPTQLVPRATCAPAITCSATVVTRLGYNLRMDTMNPLATPAPTRHLALAGTTNFRDLGGYVGHDGRRVRWRTLGRSSLSN